MKTASKTITINGAPTYHVYPEHSDGGTDASQKYPALVLIEEIWGVNDHIKSIADRFAAEGFSVVAPELLPQGLLEILTPQIQRDLFDPEKRNEIQPKLRAAMEPIRQPDYAKGALATLTACVDYLLADGADENSAGDGHGVRANRAVGVIGFCFGGTYAFHLAAHDARVKAAVPFYGQPPTDMEIPSIACPVLAFYGDQDAALMESLPALKEAMSRAGKPFEAVVYPGIGHAFFNDTNPRAYNREAADEAWGKALEFLKGELGK